AWARNDARGSEPSTEPWHDERAARGREAARRRLHPARETARTRCDGRDRRRASGLWRARKTGRREVGRALALAVRARRIRLPDRLARERCRVIPFVSRADA